MNREEAINMTREIRGDKQEYLGGPGFTWDELVEFANRVVAATYEECAQICDAYGMPDGTSETAAILARAIRMKGKML